MKEEIKRKISDSHKGMKASLETRKKMSDSKKRAGIRPPSQKGKKQSKEHSERISRALTGRKRPPFSEEWRKKMGRSGDKNHLWKGGITPINIKIRTSWEYKVWREAVFRRDGWTCIWCGQKGGKIQADHIKKFCDYPELRFAIDNGRTLCEKCHKTTDTYRNKGGLNQLITK